MWSPQYLDSKFSKSGNACQGPIGESYRNIKLFSVLDIIQLSCKQMTDVKLNRIK